MVVYTLEQRWEVDADFGKKNHFFRLNSFWSWRVCKQLKLSHLGHRKPAYIEKPTHPKRVTVWCGFWSTGIFGPFFFENQQWEAVTVNGDLYRAMLNEYWKRRILATFGFTRTALRATQPKLRSMFCALKIAFLVAELTSFDQPGAAIWHRWTIICELPSNIRVTPTSQRQLML